MINDKLLKAAGGAAPPDCSAYTSNTNQNIVVTVKKAEYDMGNIRCATGVNWMGTYNHNGHALYVGYGGSLAEYGLTTAFDTTTKGTKTDIVSNMGIGTITDIWFNGGSSSTTRTWAAVSTTGIATYQQNGAVLSSNNSFSGLSQMLSMSCDGTEFTVFGGITGANTSAELTFNTYKFGSAYDTSSITLVRSYTDYIQSFWLDNNPHNASSRQWSSSKMGATWNTDGSQFMGVIRDSYFGEFYYFVATASTNFDITSLSITSRGVMSSFANSDWRASLPNTKHGSWKFAHNQSLSSQRKYAVYFSYANGYYCRDRMFIYGFS